MKTHEIKRNQVPNISIKSQTSLPIKAVVTVEKKAIKKSRVAEANLAEGIDKTITKSVNISLVDNLKMV